MAERLARTFGTEEDKINCPFYYKIGACRHGERCSRVHMKPSFSQTLIIPHMYTAPPPGPDGVVPDDTERFEEFYEEIVEELTKFGYVEQLHVVENLGDHMFGNVYVKYSSEEESEKAMKVLAGRYYAGRLLTPEYSPVTDFREARCRQYDEDDCSRGGYCNFMHLKRINGHLRKYLRKANKQHPTPPASPIESRRRSSRSPPRGGRGGYDRDRGNRGGGGGGGYRGGGDRDRHDRDRHDKDRDRDRDRHDRDRRDRDRHDRDRDGDRDRGRDRDRGHDRDGDRDRDGGREKDQPSQPSQPGGGESAEFFARSSSAERRAKFAAWNKAKEEAKRQSDQPNSGYGEPHAPLPPQGPPSQSQPYPPPHSYPPQYPPQPLPPTSAGPHPPQPHMAAYPPQEHPQYPHDYPPPPSGGYTQN